MKVKRTSIMIILPGLLITGVLLYLYVAFFARDTSFLLGFLTCLVFLAVILILVFVWNRHVLQNTRHGSGSSPEDPDVTDRRPPFIWLIGATMIFLAVVLVGGLLLMQKNTSRHQTAYQKRELIRQAEVMEGIRAGGMVVLLNNLLNKIDDELKNSPERVLSDETIARISALSHGFRPYRLLEGDRLTSQKYSPERGQLLLTLSKMQIDSVSFDKIKAITTFSGSYLKGANLYRAYLRDVDLRGAHLQDANLSAADLQAADLSGVRLWGAELGGANLKAAILGNADLRWADFSLADLRFSDLGGADLSFAILNNAKLTGADLRVATLHGASLKEADLEGAYMFGIDLSMADLSASVLRDVVLRDANLNGANLTTADLTNTEVREENWPVKLNEWNVTGAGDIHDAYGTMPDKTGLFFVLMRKK